MEVFVKDQVHRTKTFFEKGTLEDVLPKGFIHTFLIRHPRKTITSWYRNTLKGESGDTIFFKTNFTLKMIKIPIARTIYNAPKQWGKRNTKVKWCL